MESILGPVSRQISLQIDDLSAASAARRAANDLARACGLDETGCGRVALVATEAATNLVKHAGHGEILLRPVMKGSVAGIEILAIDKGPGMANLTYSMQDGTSTAGSYGVGLGAMQRVSDEFDVYSQAGQGTAIWMTIWADQTGSASLPWQTGVVCIPMPGESVCGDSWSIHCDVSGAGILVADGLGHGPIAAQASEAAVNTMADARPMPPSAMMQDVHGALRSTRGAAVAIASVDCGSDTVHFAGVGNIVACVIDNGQRRQLMSHNGIVGSNIRKIQEVSLPWSQQALLLMHSDGLGTRWSLDQYPGLESCHPALIAAVLYRDFARRSDDVTVLALRENRNFQS